MKDAGMKQTMVDGRMVWTMEPGAALYEKEDFPAITATTDFWGEYSLAK